MYTTEAGERLVIAGPGARRPAERAGVRVGAVLEVAGARPNLADLWRKIWEFGPSGAVVPLKLGRNGKTTE